MGQDIIADSEAVADKSSSNNTPGEPKSKSPKYIPKFLRASFSKLISKDKSKSQSSSSQEPVSLPFFSSISIPSLNSPSSSSVYNQDQEDSDSNNNEDTATQYNRACSPTTQQFVEESIAKGFPLIPFHYTSLDIVERGRALQRNKEQHLLTTTVVPDFTSSEEAETSPARAKYRRLHSDSERVAEQDVKEKSLQSVLNLAQQELELEANDKKVIL